MLSRDSQVMFASMAITTRITAEARPRVRRLNSGSAPPVPRPGRVSTGPRVVTAIVAPFPVVPVGWRTPGTPPNRHRCRLLAQDRLAVEGDRAQLRLDLRRQVRRGPGVEQVLSQRLAVVF